MRRIISVLVVRLMAGVAKRAVQVVVIVLVTVGALPWRNRMRARQLESRAGVIERGV